jgi:hypothetical protein
MLPTHKFPIQKIALAPPLFLMHAVIFWGRNFQGQNVILKYQLIQPVKVLVDATEKKQYIINYLPVNTIPSFPAVSDWIG